MQVGDKACPVRADTVAKVFLFHWTQIFRAAGAAFEKLCGGLYHCELGSQATSAARLKAHRSAITACYVISREICRAAFWDFCNKIGQQQSFNQQLNCHSFSDHVSAVSCPGAYLVLFLEPLVSGGEQLLLT